MSSRRQSSCRPADKTTGLRLAAAGHTPARRIGARLTAATAGMLATATVALAQDVCGPLAAGDEIDGALIESVSVQTQSAAAPAHCEVRAVISPEPGSRIGALYRLPADWNGRVLGVGGGGFAGNLSLEAAVEGLTRGYAVIQNDLGHPSTSALDPSFAMGEDGRPNVPGIVDFGHRATHLATVAGKAIAERRYGEAPRFAYWQGCSTGGRQGLAEAQRYPDDYDGVIAGAPVYTPVTYSNAILRVQAFHARKGGNLSPEQVPLIEQAVLAACDGLDGVEDGILTDPRQCRWDPAELACPAESGADRCLTPAQVETVRTVYEGVRMSDGSFAAMPLMRGGESDWAVRMIGNEAMPLGLNARLGAPFMSYIVAGDPDYDLLSFDPDTDMERLGGGIAAAEVHQQDPDITDFVAGGGKLLLWHGFNDPGPSPLSTIEYFEAVQSAVPAAKDSVRLFLAPGVLHCRGGAGPDRFDALAAIEDWVERGAAPEQIVAARADASLSRPLCPFPALPRYRGSGDPDDAASFECAVEP